MFVFCYSTFHQTDGEGWFTQQGLLSHHFNAPPKIKQLQINPHLLQPEGEHCKLIRKVPVQNFLAMTPW